ncbi:hypothetical protein EGW08_006580 [Elysia chlorotica]|uniref:HAP1 N-terminal domain-containing protein n=1 Tax=Elysia chlorotica TaxID=188477 RepID=A0A3S0ZSB2_ELYCH|nr:hypothetical protein EGW08_006580 [Elysia chlorotica]
MSGFQSPTRSNGPDAAGDHPLLNFPASASSGDQNEDADVYQRLAQKERDLILAAELGKALLDSNQELQTQYDQTVEEYSLKVEELQQEKHGLHLELEKMEREYQNAIKDLQDDVASLQKQIRDGAEQQVVEKESSRFLREAQGNIDYLMEQIKKATTREEELTAELNEERNKNKSSSATVQDQVDHIAMLREQIEYLSVQLKETNEKLEEVQSERDNLSCALEKAQEMLQVLEAKISHQTEKLHRQETQLEELQESNCELQQQVNHLQSTQHHKQQLVMRASSLHTHSFGTHNSRVKSHVVERSNQRSLILQKKPKSLLLEMPQKSQLKELLSDEIADPSRQKGSQLVSTAFSEKQHDCDNVDNIGCSDDESGLESGYPTVSDISNEQCEQSLFAELCNSLSEEQSKNSLPGAVKLSSHRRNASDCSLSSLNEGSRKRQHNNIRAESDESDDDRTERSGCKQTLYSQDRDKLNRLSHNSSFELDACISNGKARWDKPGKSACLTSWTSSDNISDHAEDDAHEFTSYHVYSSPFDDAEPVSLQLMHEMNVSSSCEDDTKELTTGPCMRDLSQFTELSPVSEIPPLPHLQEDPPEQSLFSELSSHMSEEKLSSGSSEASPGCAMGVFDFCAASHGSQDGDVPDQQSVRLEAEMMNSGDWNQVTSLPCDMLEEDDFECDDDDFLVGNTEGTTLSIGGGGHSMLYYSPNVYSEAACNMHTEAKFLSFDKEAKNIEESEIDGITQDANKSRLSPCPATEEQKISEACKQLRELVGKAHAGGLISEPKSDSNEFGTDTLLALIAQLRLCVESACADKQKKVGAEPGDHSEH